MCSKNNEEDGVIGRKKERGNVVGHDAADESKSQIMRLVDSKECVLGMTPRPVGSAVIHVVFFPILYHYNQCYHDYYHTLL